MGKRINVEQIFATKSKPPKVEEYSESPDVFENTCRDKAWYTKHSPKMDRLHHIVSLLRDPDYNPSVVMWFNKAERIFTITNKKEYAKLRGLPVKCTTTHEKKCKCDNPIRLLRLYSSAKKHGGSQKLRSYPGQNLTWQILDETFL